jgi:thioredoxin-dependent peroxiredoxin
VVQTAQGDRVGALTLPNIDGSEFNIDSVSGKRYLLSFYRFASCPFCNMRIHSLVAKYDQLPDDFEMIAIFDSPLDNLQRYATGHNAPFPILADAANTYYRKFGVQCSLLGVLKGGILRMPTVLYAMFGKGYIPWTVKGSMTTMPLDMLVDESGIVQSVYYGADEGDHMPFSQIMEFARGA